MVGAVIDLNIPNQNGSSRKSKNSVPNIGSGDLVGNDPENPHLTASSRRNLHQNFNENGELGDEETFEKNEQTFLSKENNSRDEHVHHGVQKVRYTSVLRNWIL